MPPDDPRADPLIALRRLTQARIALGRRGVSLPTHAHLAFQLAHAQARDAVHLALDPIALAERLSAMVDQPILQLHSAAPDRDSYLQRPDLGRRLDEGSRRRLSAGHRPAADLAIVIADGLSAPAIERNAAPLLALLLPALAQNGFALAPLAIVEQGRVAVGDEIGALTKARAVLVLIGERPGLSSPDSMGLYLTWAPRVGVTDAARNCISNVRPDGLSYDEALRKLRYLLDEARRRGMTGVDVKDETREALPRDGGGNFLLG
jgi:ethanolamine ammonia-lyase small subunit